MRESRNNLTSLMLDHNVIISIPSFRSQVDGLAYSMCSGSQNGSKILNFYNVSTKDKTCCPQDTSLETLRQNEVPGFSCLVLTVCLHHHTVPEMICTLRTPPQSADEDHTYAESHDSSGLNVKDLWNGGRGRL